MSEFKRGDEVEVIKSNAFGITIGSRGVIKGPIENYPGKWNVKFDFSEELYVFVEHHIKLIPKLKTLAELWEENGKPIDIIGSDGRRARLRGFDKHPLLAMNDSLYSLFEAQDLLGDWQLYQEPEEDLFLTEARKAQAELGKKLNLEKKSAEKCEHEEKYIHQTFAGKIDCKNCGVELVEKWLWWIEGANGGEYISDRAYAEEEAKARFFDGQLIKKATNSRELFEVGK